MTKKVSLTVVATLMAFAALATVSEANAAGFLRANRRAAQYNWHSNYVHSAYGQPVALVVPPTAQLQTNWSWGAPSAHFSRIDHQYGRNDQGAGAMGGVKQTPRWPNNMHQHGVEYVRGPWYPTQR